MKIEFYVNGDKTTIDVPPQRRLLDILHDDLELIEVKEGCGNGECGACTVLMDGRRVNSCLIPAVQIQGTSIITLNGLKKLPSYHKIEKAYVDYGAVQCGFCMGGFMMSTASFLTELTRPVTPPQILEAFAGNLCRCTGYTKIMEAIEQVVNDESMVTDFVREWNAQFGQIKNNIPVSPANLDDLNTVIQNGHPDLVFIAGGTDLMVQKHKMENKTIVDISKVKELAQTIEISDKGILIGAAVPIAHLIEHDIIRSKFPVLIEALKQIGAPQIQNRATLGGNIANASPAGDAMPPLAALDAELWIGPAVNGSYEKLGIDAVMVGPGVNSLSGKRYIAYIFLPYLFNGTAFYYYRKVGQRKAMAISKLAVAVVAGMQEGIINDIRICAGSVTPQIKRAEKTERLLKGQELTDALIETARKTFMTEVTPITDIRSTADYRQNICGEVLRDALYQLKQA